MFSVARARPTRRPGATIILAEIDLLRSEGETLAKRLKEAGSDVHYKVFKGMTP
jgi:acetyl esterase/lipase